MALVWGPIKPLAADRVSTTMQEPSENGTNDLGTATKPTQNHLLLNRHKAGQLSRIEQ